jgi:hypothetical protein
MWNDLSSEMQDKLLKAAGHVTGVSWIHDARDRLTRLIEKNAISVIRVF